MRTFLHAAVLSVLLALVSASAATAGQFKVYSCKLPDGSVAATDGWVADDPSFGFTTTNACESGGSLRVAMASIGMPEGVERSWNWTARPGVTLASAELWRSAMLGPGTSAATPVERILVGGSSLETHGTSTPYGDGQSSVGSTTWNAPSNRLAIATASGSSVALSIGCRGGTGSACPNSGGSDSEGRLHAATFTLADSTEPVVSGVSGSLTTSAAKSGDADLTFSASDSGAGVYRALVTVDGVRTASPVLDLNGGRCGDVVPASADPYEFEYQQPCAAAVSAARVVLDTRGLADGDHRVSVDVEDASGNRAAVYGPATIAVRNAAPVSGTQGGSGAGTGAGTGSSGSGTQTGSTGVTDGSAAATTGGIPNGLGATPDARLALPALTVNGKLRIRYGQTPVLTGRLTRPDGLPIAGATIEILERTLVGGARDRAVGAVRTDAAGGFSYRLAVGASRNLRFGYRANTGDAQPARSVDVTVLVVPRITFRLSRNALRNGQTLKFIGRIAGPYTKGRLAELRVRSGKRWIVVCVVRTRTGGQLGCSYRFRNTFHRTRYTFRVMVRRQAGFPYEPATSAVRTVLVRP